METINGQICISHAELTGRIITTANLNALVRKGQVQQVRKGGNGRTALFVVDSLPLKWRTEVYRRYPDLQEQADSKEFMDTIEPDGAALLFYQDYKLPDGRNLPELKQVELSNNCAIMNAFRRCIEDCQSKRSRSGNKRVPLGEFWRKAANSLEYLADRFPHSLPRSARRLQMKFAEYVEQGYVCFISGKYQNSNAGKVVTEDQESLLATILGHHNNLSDVRVAEYYNHAAREIGWKEITPAAVRVWREKMDVVVSAGRLGVSNFRNNKEMQVKRSRPTAPFLMWTLDGWTVELLYQDTKQTKRGNVTTYTNRLTMVVVLDPCNDYPIGYAVGTHECPELIKEALRNAAIHSRELFGEMLRANQIQCDHYAFKAMSPLYAVMGEKLTPARVKNAKAKRVESYFNYINTTFCNRFNNWSGYGVTTDPKKQPNSEALNQLRHRFPDEQGVRKQIDEIMYLERMSKVDKFRELMQNLAPERRLPLSREQYLLNFGAETGFKNALEGCGLRPTILGVKRDYDCFDLTFREHAAERWTVKYDPDDLSEVLAVNDDGTRRYMLTEKYVQPMALADRKPGDYEQLERVNNFNKELEKQTAERIAAHYQRTEQLIASTPALRGSIEDRLLLTDSRGQHKDQRSRKRLAVEEVEALEIKTVEVPVIPQGAAATDTSDYRTDDYSIF